jgi:hypothetical protein
MSFWQNFAKYGLMAAPYIAAPMTGGASIPLGAAIGAGRAAVGGGGAGDIALGAGMGALGPATSALGPATSSAIQASASGGLSAMQPGGLATMEGTPYEVTPPPPAPTAEPGFWSKVAAQAKEGMGQRDFWTTAAQSIAGGLEASRANRLDPGDIRALEWIQSGGAPSGPLGISRGSTSREQEEARKRLAGPGFWEQFLTYGAVPGMALYGATKPPNRPQGGQ